MSATHVPVSGAQALYQPALSPCLHGRVVSKVPEPVYHHLRTIPAHFPHSQFTLWKTREVESVYEMESEKRI